MDRHHEEKRPRLFEAYGIETRSDGVRKALLEEFKRADIDMEPTRLSVSGLRRSVDSGVYGRPEESIYSKYKVPVGTYDRSPIKQPVTPPKLLGMNQTLSQRIYGGWKSSSGESQGQRLKLGTQELLAGGRTSHLAQRMLGDAKIIRGYY